MVTATPLRHFFTLGLLVAGALALIVTRPRLLSQDLNGSNQSASCLQNLSQISRAFALYARDFDGKLPRAADPEDHFKPQNWNYTLDYGSAFGQDALQAPLLHQVLRPYVSAETTFRCPSDNGWTQTRLPGNDESKLRDVSPSSFLKYGTSYYYSTIYGFQLKCAADIENPAQRLLLFDGDLWHPSGSRPSLNGLFVDGHAQNLSAAQFDASSRE